jgi:uncharacterized protein (DUF4415 family)
MPSSKFRPGRGYSKADWDEVSESPELSEADFAKARPARDVLPESFFASMKEHQRDKVTAKEDRQETVSLRLDRDVLAEFRKCGKDWQARINTTLRKAIGLSDG